MNIEHCAKTWTVIIDKVKKVMNIKSVIKGYQ